MLRLTSLFVIVSSLLAMSTLYADSDVTLTFGSMNDTPVTGDWNGDGVDDVGVNRATDDANRWFIDANGNRGWDGVSGGDVILEFGAIGDTPITGDWNNDGVDEIGVVHGTSWFLDANGNGMWDGNVGGDLLFEFGAVNDTPVTGDWNNDGVDEIGVHKVLSDGIVPDRSMWYLDANGNHQWDGREDGDLLVEFGHPGDVPIVGDWNGDGTDEIGVRRVDQWFLDANGNFRWDPGPLGDLNEDGLTNGLDIDPFVVILINGPLDHMADMNGDSAVNGLDVDLFVAAVVGSGAQQIPEPSTLLLCLITLGMVGGWRKRGG